MSKRTPARIPPPPATPRPPAPARGRHFAVLLLLAALTFAVYWPAQHYDFVNYDDDEYAYQNPHVLGGLTREGIRWAFTTHHAGFWQPLTWLSFMLDVQWFGPGAGGMHITNALLHAANAVLVLVLLRGLTRAHWRSLLVAALFALHPLRVESVAWVTERKDVLSTFFGLLSLIFYARYAQGQARGPWSVVRGPWSVVPYLASLVCFACGLMSKAMVVTLPFVLLLLDYWPLQRFTIHGSRFTNLGSLQSRGPWSVVRGLFWEKLPFFLLSGMVSVLTVWVQSRGGALAGLAQLPVVARVSNALVAYAVYLGKTLWPVKLAVFYPYAKEGTWLQAGLALGLMAGLSVAAWVGGRRRGYLRAGWFWFVVTLLPVIGLFQSGQQALADRFTYVPLLGLFVVAAWGLGEVAERWPRVKYLLVTGTGLALVALTLRTMDQLRHWRNSETLFRHALAVTRNNDLAHVNLGSFLAGQEKDEEAMEHYRRALELNPDNTTALNGLGFVLRRRGDTESALRRFREALRRRPDDAVALNNLGGTLAFQGQLDEALATLRRAVQLRPDYPDARFNLGNALALQGQLDAAVAEFREAVRLQPDHVKARGNLGNALGLLGRWPEAAACYQELLRRAPDDAAAHASLGRALAEQGLATEALPHIDRALQLAPDDAGIHFQRGCALIKMGRTNEAVAEFFAVLKFRPADPEARQKLDELGIKIK